MEFTKFRDVSFRVGQYKLYYSRQRVISSGNQEFVDRTLAQGEFNLDRDIGFHLFSKDLGGIDRLKYYAGVTIGEGRDKWTTQRFSGTDAGGLQYLVRLEYLPFGGFKDYTEVDFERSNRFRMSIGGAYAFLDDGTTPRGYLKSAFDDGGTIDVHNAAGDIFFKWAGVTGLAEFYWRHGTRDQGAGEGATPGRNGIGYTGQLAFLVPKVPLGIGARYSGVSNGWYNESETSLTDSHELGATIGYYFAGHPLKLQFDYFHLWDDVIAEGSERLRLQLQFAY